MEVRISMRAGSFFVLSERGITRYDTIPISRDLVMDFCKRDYCNLRRQPDLTSATVLAEKGTLGLSTAWPFP